MKRHSLTVLILSLALSIGCSPGARQIRDALPGPDLLRRQCELIGEPRIERISEHVWAAVGYDLANEILIHTPEGSVIVDPLMSPKRGEAAKRDLLANVPAGPVKAVIYTHSHIDHIGGASLWMEDRPQIWATDTFTDHFYKQYQLFLPIETIRGRRQFGDHVSLDDLPCNGIGRRTDIRAAQEGAGIRLPTNTFSGTKTLVFGGLEIRLIEAPGETHDQLVIWVPQDRTVIAADNFYWTFPNLYTIRGASPRPIDGWIKSLDEMRALNPEHLVPCHTVPVHGAQNIAEVLTNYRDAIQWVRDETVRLANMGYDMDAIAETVTLPPHLAGLPYTTEFYGQVDWSARAVYTNNLGWFDGRPEKLYPMKVSDAAGREVRLMGGADQVMKLSDAALTTGDFRWAIHLLTKLRDSGLATGSLKGKLDEKLAGGYEGLASTLYNLNGRGYLLESAYEIRHGIEKPAQARLDENVVANIPLDAIFTIMAARLVPERAMDVHETVYYVFPDEQRRFIVTVRNGIAEVVQGDPLPGTPEPVATLVVDALTYRKMAAKVTTPLAALASGKLKVQGSWLRFLAFNHRFDLD
ncbi:MAG TPA: alkyl sulfatase dimerization domain-containing protein [Deltaproteobacteria bacterium]|nr:alkyl sulfatase dimerization domain-containing protein [Deltaproteobacteria bacterium]HPR54888.1 alkyl sulfatase dimerization domain-containing protein [Deltaproteobacteria bacterium]HXK48509.1 alkyl sulfatase dimerization domain-containing protein [Deltaproteobacteria bacterium]